MLTLKSRINFEIFEEKKHYNEHPEQCIYIIVAIYYQCLGRRLSHFSWEKN